MMVSHIERRRISVSHAERNMTRVLLLVVGLIVTGSAAADEFYVPLGNRMEGSCITEVRIANGSDRSMTVAIERLAALESVDKATRLTLAGGETTEWSDDSAQDVRTDRLAALAITADGPLVVTAIRRCAARGAISKVGVLDARSAIHEGAIAVGTANTAWKKGIGVINPGAAGVLLTASLHRGEETIDEASVYIPGRAARAVFVDDLFSVSATDPNDWASFSAQQSVLPFGYASNERTGAEFFTPPAPAATSPVRRRAVRPGSPPQPSLQTVVLTPSKDNTLYESSNGSLSNGTGIHLFAGMTNGSQRRRALLAFDIASQIPPGSQITDVALKLEVSQTASGPELMALHRVSADWGEGSSNAGPSRDGDGAASRAGDATWIHTFFPDRSWTKAGGDFDVATDATAPAAFGPVTWGSSAAMIARLQDWLDQPSTNFGWIIVGNEATARTAKRFDSREITASTARPSLTIEFRK
jgi:hypothetical protein